MSEDPRCMSSQNRGNEEARSSASHIIIMQEPSKEVEASIPPLKVKDDANLNRKFTARRKAAKRTLPWDLKADEIKLAPPWPPPPPPPPPEDESIPPNTHQRRTYRLA